MGLLITFEGGEFVGKTTVAVPAVLKILQTLGVNVISSREPGGTLEGEKIRKEIFTRLEQGASSEELAMLFFRARKIHLDEVVLPFLETEQETKKVVLLDRYLDSSMVLQGMEGGVDVSLLLKYVETYAYNIFPDLTIILYIPEEKFPDIFKLRKRYDERNGQRDKNGWDEGDVMLQLQRQRNYCSLPLFFKKLGIPRNFVLVDASLHPCEVIKICALQCFILLQSHNFFTNISDRSEFDQVINLMEESGGWDHYDKVWNEQQLLLQEIINRKDL